MVVLMMRYEMGNYPLYPFRHMIIRVVSFTHNSPS